jgi:hypothetical protein
LSQDGRSGGLQGVATVEFMYVILISNQRTAMRSTKMKERVMTGEQMIEALKEFGRKYETMSELNPVLAR